MLALTQATMGRCAEAEGGLSRALNGSDTDLARLAGLAQVQCQLSANQPDRAADLADALKAKFPTDPDVLYVNARAHMRAWNDAIFKLYKAAPGSYRVNQLSAEVLETQGRFAEAVAEYRKAIEKNPRALNLHFRLGRSLLMASHEPQSLAAALEEFRKELALNPNDAIAHYQVGQIELTQQNRNEAETSLARALALQPEFPEALILLGKLQLDAKQNEKAIESLQRAVKLMPESESAHYILMMAYRNAGRAADVKNEKAILDRLQQSPEGEFTDFLRKLGEKPAGK